MDIQQAEEDSGGDTEEYGGGDKESMAACALLSPLTAVASTFT